MGLFEVGDLFTPPPYPLPFPSPFMSALFDLTVEVGGVGGRVRTLGMRVLLGKIFFAPFLFRHLFARTYQTCTGVHNKVHDDGTRKDKQVREDVKKRGGIFSEGLVEPVLEATILRMT